jgi:probable addiction module antidote protein
MVVITRWNILEELDSEKAIASYLDAAVTDIEEGGCDAGFFLVCMADAAKARAINQLAAETGIDRKILCRLGLEESGTDAPKINPNVLVKVAKAFAAPTQV